MRQALSDWLGIVLKFVIIAAIIGGVIWVGMGVIANVTETEPNGLPKMPSISKASTIVTLTTTGEILLTPNFDVTKSPHNAKDTVYTLRGFYHLAKGKWVWDSQARSFDEYYFGKIVTVKRRR